MGTFRDCILVARVGARELGDERIVSVEGGKCGLPSESICIEVSSC